MCWTRKINHAYKTIWVSFMIILISFWLTNWSHWLLLIPSPGRVWLKFAMICIMQMSNLFYKKAPLSDPYKCLFLCSLSHSHIRGLYILGPKQISYFTNGCQDYWWRSFILLGRWQAYRVWETKVRLSFIFQNSSLLLHPCFYWVC